MELWPEPWGRCRVMSASCCYCPQGLLQVEEMADFPRLPVGLPLRHSWPGTHAHPLPCWGPQHSITRPIPESSHGLISSQHVIQMSPPSPVEPAMWWKQVTWTPSGHCTTGYSPRKVSLCQGVNAILVALLGFTYWDSFKILKFMSLALCALS